MIEVAIVANPYSGATRNRERVQALVAALESAGFVPRLCWQAEELRAITAGGDCRAVLSAGGDGTLNRVVNLRPAVPVAMFPLGNENLFAQEFGYQADPGAVVRMLQAGRTQRIDLGCNGERLFVAVSSCGFAAEVIHRLARWRERTSALKRVRRRTYVRPILGAGFQYAFPEFDLVADGVRYRGTQSMVFNLPRYAFNLGLCPDAKSQDGLLDWVLFPGAGRIALARNALSVWRGQHLARADVQHGQARVIRLEAATPVPMELDGEEAGFAPTEITVLPAALEILVES